MERYEIRVEGHLPLSWSDWLGGLAIQLEADGTSRLRGELPDQTALHGVLERVRDLNLRLLSVLRLPDPSSNEG